MKTILSGVVVISLATSLNAQLWDGSPLPPSWSGTPAIDSYFSDGGGLSEFDMDTGFEFSLREDGTVPANIDAAHGWIDAANFGIDLEAGDTVIMTYLGNTAAWQNDFGVNLGGTGASGPGAFTLWSGINNDTPTGIQYQMTMPDDAVPTSIDFWLNSNAATHGGTYSAFYPGSSTPANSGLPEFDYSAFGRLFNVFDDGAGANRWVLVLALEDWRGFDADLTDNFFAIEIYDRNGEPQFPIYTPEPATYGLIGAAALLALTAVRRYRLSRA